MRWHTYKLGELCNVQSGGTPRRGISHYYGGDIPWVKIGDMDAPDGLVIKTEETITRDGLEEINNRLFSPGTLLLAMYGSVGKIAVAGRELSTNQAILGIAIRNKAQLDSRYLFRWLASIQSKLIQRARGATLQNISATIVKDLRVPLPPLEEQHRIATILDKVDSLCNKRRQAIELARNLSKSIFMDLFGDPNENPKKWKIAPLAELCEVSGEYGAGVPSTQYNSDLPRYIRITDINKYGELNEEKVSPGGIKTDWEGCVLSPGDVLFARSGATVGKTYLHSKANGNCVYAGYLIRFRPNPKYLTPGYLFHFTRTDSYKSWVSQRQRVVAQPNINAQQYGYELFVPVPPLEIQKRFDDTILRIAALVVKQEKYHLESENLLASMQQNLLGNEETNA